MNDKPKNTEQSTKQTAKLASDWHLDRRFSLGLICAILIQSGSAIWWASSLTEQMQAISDRQSLLGQTDQRQWDEINTLKLDQQRIAKMEGTLEQMAIQMRRLADAVDRLNGRAMQNDDRP